MITQMPEYEALLLVVQVLGMKKLAGPKHSVSTFPALDMSSHRLKVHILESGHVLQVLPIDPSVFILSGNDKIPEILLDQSLHHIYQTTYSAEQVQDALQTVEQNASYLHGNAVVVDGVGVYLSGAPGQGKSLTTLQLLTAGHKLIADDVVYLSVLQGNLWAVSPMHLYGWMHVREKGFFNLNVMQPNALGARCSRITMHMHISNTHAKGVLLGTYSEFCLSEHMVLSNKKEENISFVEQTISYGADSKQTFDKHPVAVGI